MGQIVRVTTKDQVYLIGNPLPVPAGYDAEPFIIRQINWDQEGDIIEFICEPDFEAASNTPERSSDMTDRQWELVVKYHEQARAAIADKLVLSAVIPFDGSRVEMLLTADEVVEAEAEEEAEEEEADEAVDEAKADTLPPEISVNPS